jgi:hypothetical protein
VDLITNPGRAALTGMVCFRVIWRTDHQCTRWCVVCVPLLDCTLNIDVLLHPDATQRFGRWHFTQSGGGVVSKDLL